jgi:hypothetical protein
VISVSGVWLLFVYDVFYEQLQAVLFRDLESIISERCAGAMRPW